MLIVLAFNPKDEALALRNANWLSQQTTPGKHKVLIGHDSRCNPEPIKQALAKSFEVLGTVSIKDPYNKWPESANEMFSQCARYLEYSLPTEKYFLWLEPDCILVKKDGLDKIQAEFMRGRKPFMGGFVPRFHDSPDHMSGNAIYPNPLVMFAGLMLLSAGEKTPFDLIDAANVMQQAHLTDLIQHKWSNPSNPNPPFTSMEDIKSRMTNECVLYHSDKTGSIIDVLGSRHNELPVCSPSQAPTDSRVSSKEKLLEGRHGNKKALNSRSARGSLKKRELPKPVLQSTLDEHLEAVSKHFTSPLAKGRIFRKLKSYPVIKNGQ